MRKCGKKYYSRRGHRWRYNTVHAHCMLYTQGYKHKLTLRNIYCFPTATLVVRRNSNYGVRTLPVLFQQKEKKWLLSARHVMFWMGLHHEIQPRKLWRWFMLACGVVVVSYISVSVAAQHAAQFWGVRNGVRTSAEGLARIYKMKQRQVLENNNLNTKYFEIVDFVKWWWCMWKI